MLLVLFIVCLFVLHLPELYSPMRGEGDAYSRSNIATRDHDSHLFMNLQAVTWLPLHATILSTSLYIYSNPAITLRVITLIFSVTTILVLNSYADLFTKSKQLKLFICVFCSFLPLTFFLSTITLSEPVFLFFLLASLVLLSPEKNIQSHFFGIALFNIAAGIRYEAWYLLPILWILIYLQPLSLAKKVMLGLSSILFPSIWLLGNYVQTHQLLYFLQIKYFFAQSHPNVVFFHLIPSFQVWFDRLTAVFPVAFICLYFLGLFSLVVQKRNQYLLVLGLFPLYLFLMLVAQVYVGSMEWEPSRYLLIPVAFTTPLIGVGAQTLHHLLKKISVPAIISKCLLLIFFSLQITLLLSHSDALSPSNGIPTTKQLEDIVSTTKYLKSFSPYPYSSDALTYFYYKDSNQQGISPAFWYFLNPHTPQSAFPISTFSENSKTQSTIVYEKNTTLRGIKDIPTEIPQTRYKLIYENDSFYVLTKMNYSLYFFLENSYI